MTPENRNLPVPLSFGRQSDGPRAVQAARPTAPFIAQLLGQVGVGRGLKGGLELPAEARTAYLRREYSGDGDRRLPPGILRRTNI